MDSLDMYREIIKELLTAITRVPYAYGEIYNETVFDDTHDRYVVLTLGWDDTQRVHDCLIHLDIIDGKIWIQQDNTDYGIANDLMDAGIPREALVPVFHPLYRSHFAAQV